MKIIIKVRRDEVWESLYLPFYLLFKKNNRHWEAAGAFLSLSGGILCPIAGAILNILFSFTRLGQLNPGLYNLYMFLHIVTVPLLILGAHFLGLLGKKGVEIRRNEAKSLDQIAQLGLKAEDC